MSVTVSTRWITVAALAVSTIPFVTRVISRLARAVIIGFPSSFLRCSLYRTVS
jgi:hypothetical protein